MFGNSRNFYGKIVSGNGKQGSSIKFYDSLSDHQFVSVRRRIIIDVLDSNEEEKDHNHHNSFDDDDDKRMSPTILRFNLQMNFACKMRKQSNYPKYLI